MAELLEWMITAAMVVGIVWISMHYLFGSRIRPMDAAPAHNASSIVQLAELADRLETRIQTLERLLDVSNPDWRKKA